MHLYRWRKTNSAESNDSLGNENILLVRYFFVCTLFTFPSQYENKEEIPDPDDDEKKIQDNSFIALDVHNTAENKSRKPNLRNQNIDKIDISDGLILLPANQTFFLNILEKEQIENKEIAPIKQMVRQQK